MIELIAGHYPHLFTCSCGAPIKTRPLPDKGERETAWATHLVEVLQAFGLNVELGATHSPVTEEMAEAFRVDPKPRCRSHNKEGRRCHGNAGHYSTTDVHWAGASHFWTEAEGSDFVVFTVSDAKTRRGVVVSRDSRGYAVIEENETGAHFDVLAGNWGPPRWVT